MVDPPARDVRRRDARHRPLIEAIARTGRSLYALTNRAAETWPRGVKEFPFFEELLNGIVVSGQEGRAKPDPRVFEILNDRFDLDPRSTAYIDDSAANIAAATSPGYITHHFATTDRLRAWLTEFGLLAAA